VVWPSGPLEVIAAFDRSVDPSVSRSLVGKSIAYFKHEGQVNDRAPARPWGSLRIVGSRLIDDGRTLILATDPHPRLARYVLPALTTEGNPAVTRPVADGPTYDLSGVEVAWSQEGDSGDRPRWTGWWPLLDLEAIRRLTLGSKRHEEGLALLSRPGRLALGTFVRLPRGTVTLRLEASQPIEEASLGDAQAELAPPRSPGGPHRALMTVASGGDPLFLTITLRTGAYDRPFSLKTSYQVGEEKIDYAIDREQLLLSWAPVAAPAGATPLVVPDLAGGDPVRGRMIFNSEQARCVLCHAFRGQGGKVGPDLTEVSKKGRAELYRAIAAPSAAIDPQYLSYTVASRDGQVIMGLVRAEGADSICVTDTNAHSTIVARGQIEQIRPSANSIMPVGLTGALGEGAVRDLIAYLTLAPPPVVSRPAK